MIDEPVGRGRATVFSADPNYRAFTTGFQQILRNALLGPEPEFARGGRRLRAPRPGRRWSGGLRTPRAP